MKHTIEHVLNIHVYFAFFLSEIGKIIDNDFMCHRNTHNNLWVFLILSRRYQPR